MFIKNTAKNSCALQTIRFIYKSAFKNRNRLSIEPNEHNKNYYRNIGVNQDVTGEKPEGWDRAKPFESVPGPKPLPVVGNILKFLPYFGKYGGMDMVDILKSLNQEYGDVVSVRKIDGSKSHIFLFRPEDMEILFRNEGFWPQRVILPGAEYYRRYIRNDVYHGLGLAISQGKEWFDLRTIVNPIVMQPRAAEMYIGRIDEVATEFVDIMKYLAAKSERSEMPADFINELNKFSMESICLIALDKRLGCLNRNLKPDSDEQIFINHIVEFFDLVYKIEILPSLWRYFSTPTWKRYVEVMDFITYFVLKHIKESKSNEEKSILQKLRKIDEKLAIITALDLINSGIDTTSKTVSATLYFLAKNKDKQIKLRKELIELLPSRDVPITEDVLREASYLKAVVKETQRLAPVSLVNYRQTVKDLVIGGYQIPKGSHVQTANYVTSRSEKYFKRAAEFIPERWLRSEIDGELSYKNVNPFVSLPFGFGPRSCAGKRIANMETEIIVAKICRNFHLDWPHEDITFKTNIVHGIEGDLRLRIKQLSR